MEGLCETNATYKETFYSTHSTQWASLGPYLTTKWCQMAQKQPLG